MGRYFKRAMFFTSFIPLWITVAFIDILSFVNGNPNPYTEIISLIFIIIGMIISILIIFGSMKELRKEEYRPYRICEVTQEKGITSEFLLSYILPLFAFNFEKWDGVVQFLIYFVILAFLCIRNNNVYANLLFEIKKYKFYSCELIWEPEPQTPPIQGMLISKDNLCANKGNVINIASLNKPFYIAKTLRE